MYELVKVIRSVIMWLYFKDFTLKQQEQQQHQKHQNQQYGYLLTKNITILTF